jgi:aryl-alcohol dehydrogenase-like predicted oxidoreductase
MVNARQENILPRRKLGRDGPEVSAIGYGAMGITEFYGPDSTNQARPRDRGDVFRYRRDVWLGP